MWGNYNIQTNSGGSTSSQTTNTAWTSPSALMGDAITVLSSAWSDGGGNLPNASSTTVNAACLEGIVPSATVGGTKHYSGGLENFLRLLENWSGDTLCYNGSIVAMFPSSYATNFWNTPGNYYDVPTRMWGFDANFFNPDKLPPLTPVVGYTNPPVIVFQPTDQTVPVGGTATFIVTITNASYLNYQWHFNGTNLPGAMSNLLKLTSVNTNNAGAYYLVMANWFGSVTSRVAMLTVGVTPPSLRNHWARRLPPAAMWSLV